MGLFSWLFGHSSPDVKNNRNEKHSFRKPHMSEFPGEMTILSVATSNKNKANICAIGLIYLHSEDSFVSVDYICPPSKRFSNSSYNQIYPETVKDCPKFPEALNKILPYINGKNICMYTTFHWEAIVRACAYYNIETPHPKNILDLYECSTQLFNLPSYTMDEVADKLDEYYIRGDIESTNLLDEAIVNYMVDKHSRLIKPYVKNWL